MTPNKPKGRSPAPNYAIYTERPVTYQQWKLALQKVQILYLRGQWKQCISRCSQLLLEQTTPAAYPLHMASLYFYSALSNESIARVTHPLSIAKVHTLELAKSFYQAAASLLPSPKSTPDLESTFDIDECSLTSSSDTDCSEILDYYQNSSSASGSRNGASSSSSVRSEDDTTLKPPPLLIQKMPDLHFQSSIYNSEPQISLHSSYGPPSFPAPEPASQTSASEDHLIPTDSWRQIKHLNRYNDHLSSFANMLADHILVMETMIKKAKEAQAERYFTKRLVSYGEDETARAADLKARIVRLKAKGWRRERFAPGRYQELCDRALDEL